MPPSFAVLNVRSLFSLATSLIACSFLIMYASWHTHSPSISPFPNPKFLDLKVPLWSLLVGASHFGKILCKQPERSNLPFKAFLKLYFCNPRWKLGHLYTTQGSAPTQHSCGASFSLWSACMLSHLSFTLTRKAFRNIGHDLCVKWEVLHTIDWSRVNMIILTTILVNVLERYGLLQILLFLVRGAKYFWDNSYIFTYVFPTHRIML